MGSKNGAKKLNIKSIASNRKYQVMLADIFIMILSGMLAYGVSNSLEFVSFKFNMVIPEVGIFILCNMFFLMLFKIYRNIWKYAKVSDFIYSICGLTAGMALCMAITRISGLYISNIFSLLMFLFEIIGLIVSRCLYSYVVNMYVKNLSNGKKRTLIIGAGDAARRVIQEMFLSSSSKNKPVVIVDDNHSKLNRSIDQVPIAGTTADIPKLVEKYDISEIVFAIPSCDVKNRKRIMSICTETNCNIKVMPFLNEMPDMQDLYKQLKPIKIEDLLGRDVINLDGRLIGSTVTGKVCMVTGGGGSIGSELSRQIAKYNPKTLLIVDIYENNAYDIQQELIRKYGDKLNLEVQIASVRDYNKMKLIFEKFQPELVFHAAAHKHVPLMETNPEEAIKNNVFGTFNVAKLATEYNIEKFVLISTDKAVNPTNVMGATKRCCEMIVQYMAQQKSKTEYIAVRFGNVLGSNGSVIPLFEKQIAENSPITVTHPDIIRYFMTIPEAVSLILEAATIARGGEIFVLDMGEPVKILSLAEKLIRMHGKEPYTEIPIVFSGLRPGEKLYEELLMDEEGLRSTANERIFVGQQIHVDGQSFIKQLENLKKFADMNDENSCVEELSKIVTTFKTDRNKTAVS